MHGGKAPQALNAAEQRIAEEAVILAAEQALQSRMLTVSDIEGITDPIELLSCLTAESRHFMLVLGDMVNDLKGQVHTTSFGVQQVKAVVALYERAMDRTIAAANVLAKHGFEERRIRLEENTAAALVGIVRRALVVVGDEHLRGEIAAAIITEVRALEAAPA